MLNSIVTVLDQGRVRFETISNFALFDAAGVNVESQRWLIKHIKLFCVKRVALPENSFYIKLAKVEYTVNLEAQFGLTLLVESDHLTPEQLIELKADVILLAPHIAEPTQQLPIDFDRPKMSPLDRERLLSEVGSTVSDLRTEFGGKPVPSPLEIRIEDQTVAKVEDVILTKPDHHAEAFETMLVGVIRGLHFAKKETYAQIEKMRPSGGRKKSPIVQALIEASLISRVVTFATERTPVTCVLTKHEAPGMSACIELNRIDAQDRNMEPLQ